MAYPVFGNNSTTSFIGQVNGLPPSKPNLAVIYALAAKFLGMRTLYLEAGSGAGEPVPGRGFPFPYYREFYLSTYTTEFNPASFAADFVLWLRWPISFYGW